MNLPRGKISGEQCGRLCERYRTVLFDDVVPWWMEHSLDQEVGGYYSLLARDGQPWATDKYMWMNTRQVWMLSYLCNTYESRPEWFNAARLGIEFVLQHAFKADGEMHFRLTREGQSRSEVLSLYTEVFGAIAMAEYAEASGDPWYWTRAMTMYDRLMPRLGQTSDTSFLGYPIHAQFHLHAHDLCRMTVAQVFHAIQPEHRFAEDVTRSIESILQRHWRPDMKVLLENVAPDGSPMLELPEGRMFHPGHAIESAWMLMEIAQQRGAEELLHTAVDIVLASLDQGWDHKYGGLRYLTNCDGTPTHALEADLKLWWPHGETLYALLLAWDLTGRQELADWYAKVHDYTFASFPDPEFGEWFGYLNRDGSPVWSAKANGWKGFFHLPRVLYRCYRLLSLPPI